MTSITKYTAVLVFVTTYINNSTARSNIFQTAKDLQLTTLVSLIERANLTNDLRDEGRFTLFAPSNDAFTRIPTGELDKINANATYLAYVLKNHVVTKDLPTFMIDNENTEDTLNDGIKLRLNVYNKMDIYTANGANVTGPNHVATNGIVHIIDKVLYQPSSSNAFELIASTTDLSTLLYAIAKAKLQPTLEEEGPFTIFAPTNAAFQKLPPGDFNNLINNSTAMKDVLETHVVTGSLYSPGLRDGQTVKTVNDRMLTITIKGGDVLVNGSNVTEPDVSVTNGVIHLIDTIIL